MKYGVSSRNALVTASIGEQVEKSMPEICCACGTNGRGYDRLRVSRADVRRRERFRDEGMMLSAVKGTDLLQTQQELRVELQNGLQNRVSDRSHFFLHKKNLLIITIC